MTARSQERTKKVITEIKMAVPESTGKLIFLPLDLSDLTKVKESANEFLRRE